jgi:hypothetical protein
MAANRATWDVYGYLWSSKDALLPSEQAQLELQRSVVLSQVNTIAAEFGTPRAVVEMLTQDLARKLSDTWRPWMQFPVSDTELSQDILPEIASDLRFALNPLRENEFEVRASWAKLFWRNVADSAFTTELSFRRGRHRNQPFSDCRPYFMNGVGLTSTR